VPDIEEQIRKAIEEGKFDDLAGKGKPLPIDDNPYLDPEWWVAHHVLKSSGYTLPWIEKRQKIFDQLDEARRALRRTWVWRQQALDENRPLEIVHGQWQRAQAVFAGQIQALNKEIFNLNLEVPSEHFQLPQISLEREIEALTRGAG